MRRSRWPVDQSLFSPGKTCRGCTLAHESTSADHAVFSLCGPTCGSGSLSSFLDVVLVALCAGDTSRCRRLSPKFTPRSALHGGPGGSHSRPMLPSILSSLAHVPHYGFLGWQHSGNYSSRKGPHAGIFWLCCQAHWRRS